MIDYSDRGTPRDEVGVAIREYSTEQVQWVGTQLLTILPKQKRAAKQAVIPREETLKRANTSRSTGGTYNRIGLKTEDLEYSCEEHGLEGPLPVEQRAEYASDFDAEFEVAKLTEDALLREQEIRIKDLVFNTTTWTGSDLYTDVSSAPWDAAASDAIGHVRAAREKVRSKTGMEPDTMLIGKITYNNLCANTAIIARLAGIKVATEDVIKQAMTDILGLKRILVGDHVYNASQEGAAAATISDIWGDDYAFIAVTAPQGARQVPCVGRTLLWVGDSAENVTVDMYFEDQTRSDIIRVRHFTDEKIFDAYFAHLLKVDA